MGFFFQNMIHLQTKQYINFPMGYLSLHASITANFKNTTTIHKRSWHPNLIIEDFLSNNATIHASWNLATIPTYVVFQGVEPIFEG